MTIRHLVLTLALSLAVFMAPARAQNAAAFAPDRPLRLLVGSAPGSIGDTVARIFAEAVQTQMGQRILVENRAGANGMIAMEALARSRPDGSSAPPGPWPSARCCSACNCPLT